MAYHKKRDIVVFIEACHDLLQISKTASKYLECDNFEGVAGLYESYQKLYLKSLSHIDSNGGNSLDFKNEYLPCYFKKFVFAFQLCMAGFETLSNEVIKDIDFLLPDLRNLVYEYLYDYTELNISKYPRQLFVESSEILLECIDNFGDLYKMIDD